MPCHEQMDKRERGKTESARGKRREGETGGERWGGRRERTSELARQAGGLAGKERAREGEEGRESPKKEKKMEIPAAARRMWTI